jgi:hypothetical protein
MDFRVMVRLRAHLMAAVVVGLSLGGAAEVIAESLGRASMPSTLAQYFGYGYGAGRHAPIVRTPGMHGPHVSRNVRVPRSAGPLYPAAYEPLRCYGEACYGDAAMPAVAPQPEAAPDAIPTPVSAPIPDRQVWRRNF